MKNIDGLYIHFPFCRHLCNYCDFYKHKLNDQVQVDQFEEILLKQIIENEKLLNKNKFQINTLQTLYIGGGTPSLWSQRGSAFLKENILSKITFSDDYEFTIEIDPGTWTEDEIKSWIDIGVNRFSIGVQSFDDEYLKVLDREHNKSDVIETLNYLESINANYSVDLMLGLPKLDNARDIQREILDLISYGPSHFSVYILKCRKNYPNFEILPDEDEVADEYLETCNFLKNKRYEQYEVSNFAKDKKESEHNKKYWKYESIAAIGPNSAGLIVRDNQSALRYKWKTQSEGFVVEELIETSLMIEKLYMQLRSRGCFDKNILDNQNRLAFSKLEDQWISRGYVASSSDSFELTALGYLMLDSLMDDIFNTLTL